jgi:hypothetical protein
MEDLLKGVDLRLLQDCLGLEQLVDVPLVAGGFVAGVFVLAGGGLEEVGVPWEDAGGFGLGLCAGGLEEPSLVAPAKISF